MVFPLILDVDNVAVHLHSSLFVVDLVVQVLAVVGSACGDLVHTVGQENAIWRFHILLHLIFDKRLEVLDLLARRFTVALDLYAVDLHIGATAPLESLGNSLLTGVQELDYTALGLAAVQVVILCRDLTGRARKADFCQELAFRDLVSSFVIMSG